MKKFNSPSEDGNSFATYWRLLAYLKPHLPMFFLSTFGFLVLAITQPLLAFLLQFLINALDGKNAPSAPLAEVEHGVTDTDSLNPFLVVAEKFDWSLDWVPTFSGESLGDDLNLIPLFVLAIYFMRGLGMLIGNYAIARVSEGVVHTLRTQVFDKFTTLPGVYFDSHDSGTLVAKITYNVAQVTVAITDALKIYLREGLSIIAICIVLILVNWKLTLIFLIAAPAMGLIVAIVSKRLRKISRRVQDAMGAITSISSEMIGGYRIMRIFGGESYERKRFENVSRFAKKQNIKIALTHSLGISLNQLIVAIVLCILMFIAIDVINPEGADDILVYMMLIGLLPKSVRQISNVFSKLQRALVAAQSIFEQLDEQEELDNGTYVCERAKGEVVFRNLSFIYNEADGQALDNVSLTVEAGTTVALVGRSGSGKSTLVNLIARYYDHDQGEILLDNREVNEYTLQSLRKQIALVTQNVVLFNDTVRANIAYGDLADCSDEEVKKAAENAYAMEFIADLPQGMDSEIGENGARLSGGQRQRLSIARAFLKDAPLLILDEATSALDTESEQLIQAALDNVMKNRTTLVIAHRLSTIERADKIVVMEDGKIVEQGSHQELISLNGHYAKLHAMQFVDDSPGEASTNETASEGMDK